MRIYNIFVIFLSPSGLTSSPDSECVNFSITHTRNYVGLSFMLHHTEMKVGLGHALHGVWLRVCCCCGGGSSLHCWEAI
jgi:hypothetical protein